MAKPIKACIKHKIRCETSFFMPQMSLASSLLNWQSLRAVPSHSAFSMRRSLQLTSAELCCCGGTRYSRVRTFSPFPAKST